MNLVVEILSPTTAHDDRNAKFKNYEKYGVREYWIVDLKEKNVEIFVLKGKRFLPARRVTGSGTAESEVLAGFTASMEQIFRRP